MYKLYVVFYTGSSSKTEIYEYKLLADAEAMYAKLRAQYAAHPADIKITKLY